MAPLCPTAAVFRHWRHREGALAPLSLSPSLLPLLHSQCCSGQRWAVSSQKQGPRSERLPELGLLLRVSEPPRHTLSLRILRLQVPGASSSDLAAPSPPPDPETSASVFGESSEPQPGAPSGASPPPASQPWWKVDGNEIRAKVAKLGLAAVLAYGLFDGVTYTTFFVLAFLGYEKSTGLNPAANLRALLGIVILMWTGNNVTRPFRVAGAAALAPALDDGLRQLQEALRLPTQFLAFALVVVTFASLCFSVVGLLILSRWGR